MKNNLKEKINNGTFCVLPWIHDFQHLDGKKHLCCLAYTHKLPLDRDHKSESTNELRRKIWNGEKIPHCITCYDQEKSGAESLRTEVNREWLGEHRNFPKVIEYFENWTEDVPPVVFFYDIRGNSKCNLSCITCNPDFSSLWKKELNIPIIEYGLDIDYEALRHAEKVYFNGGEPLIIDEYINILKFLVEHNNTARVSISSNLTSLRPEVIDYLKALKNVSLVVSVDAYGSVCEYVRYPFKWNKFLTNIEEISKTGITISLNTVASAVSVLGWKNLKVLDQFKLNNWFARPLSYPLSLRLENLPEGAKQYAYDQIADMVNNRMYTENVKFRNDIDYVLNTIMKPGDPSLLLKYIKELDDRRGLNHAEYLGINLFDCKL